MALWDIIGKARGEPVWRLLGYDRAWPKTPYASQLWGDTPEETRASCRAQIAAGFRAVRRGWGPFGRGTLQDDVDHLHAAREGPAGGHPARRCRRHLRRGRRGGCGPPAGARGGERNLVRGAGRRHGLRGLCRHWRQEL
ncbi:MAG: hypothetical protein R3C69_16185 [Geminicoccaceae bacterium]